MIHRDPVPRPSVISKIIKNCYLALSLYIFFYFGSILHRENTPCNVALVIIVASQIVGLLEYYFVRLDRFREKLK